MKLRYEMDFTADLYPAHELALVLEMVKRAKTHLDWISDLCVRLIASQSVMDLETAATDQDKLLIARSSRALTEHLHQSKIKAPGNSAAAFAALTSFWMQTSVRSLFHQRKAKP